MIFHKHTPIPLDYQGSTYPCPTCNGAGFCDDCGGVGRVVVVRRDLFQWAVDVWLKAMGWL